jgi:GR25 family glycosyltransferase involved in LPS biosynthesis
MIKADTISPYWDFFDKIYCISLEERSDRRKEAKIQFDKVGLSHKVEFFIAQKHPDDCEEGIYNSHLACIKKGLQAGANRMVIFEDDIRFERLDPIALKNCIDFLSSNSQWNALFFGCLVSGSKKTRNKSVLKIKYRSLSHAYALNRPFAQILAAKPWQKIAFDAMLNSSQEAFYAIYPSFAFQSNSATNNDRYVLLDKFRRLCGKLRRIQKWNELYLRYRTIIIVLHLILILAIMFWVFI